MVFQGMQMELKQTKSEKHFQVHGSLHVFKDYEGKTDQHQFFLIHLDIIFPKYSPHSPFFTNVNM